MTDFTGVCGVGMGWGAEVAVGGGGGQWGRREVMLLKPAELLEQTKLETYSECVQTDI